MRATEQAGPEDESDGGRAMPAMRERTRTTRSVLLVLGCLGAIWATGLYLQRYGLSGLAVDRGAIRAWLGGDGLYAYRAPASRLGTAAPPVAALLMIVPTALPLLAEGWLLAASGLAALLLALIALVGPVARRYGRPRWPAILIAGGLALLAEPVRATLGLGRLDLLLFGLITADVVALRRGAWARSRATWWPGRPASQPQRGRFPTDLLRRTWATGTWAGLGTGVATALAAGPALFVIYLLLTRQWRAALTALGTAATLVASTFVLAPDASRAWFGSVLLQADRLGPVDLAANQSLAGVLARLYDKTTTPVLVWLSFATLLAAVGMIRARSAHADGDEIAAFTLVGLTSAAISPVTRSYELIWALPAVLILIDAAARHRVADRRPLRPRRQGWGYATAALLGYALLVADPKWTLGWNAYALALIIAVNTLPWRPGAAPAFPINRWPGQVRRTPAIPGPRAS
jgi:alpha-1,2-mannosyltransferase